MFLLRLVILYNFFFFRIFIPAEMMNYDIVVLPTLALVKSVWLPGLRDINTNNASNGFWSFLLTHSRDNLGKTSKYMIGYAFLKKVHKTIAVKNGW